MRARASPWIASQASAGLGLSFGESWSGSRWEGSVLKAILGRRPASYAVVALCGLILVGCANSGEKASGGGSQMPTHYGAGADHRHGRSR